MSTIVPYGKYVMYSILIGVATGCVLTFSQFQPFSIVLYSLQNEATIMITREIASFFIAAISFVLLVAYRKQNP